MECALLTGMCPARFPSPLQLADDDAAKLAGQAADAALALYNTGRFRSLGRLAFLPQVEQDRILNEVVASYLVLVMLALESPDLRVSDDMLSHLASLSPRIPRAHVDYLASRGVEREYLEDWLTLMDMRHREHSKGRQDLRGELIKMESADGGLTMDRLDAIQATVPIQAVAIGCHEHICRGETAGRDELYLLLQRSMSDFYLELRASLEGIRITPLTRAKVAARRMLRRRRRHSK